MEDSNNTEIQDLTSLQKDGVVTLPNWKKIEKPFERIAGLNIHDDCKDEIILWWKENPRTLQKLTELKQASTSINLPKNEAEEIKEIYDEALTLFVTANNKLITFTDERKQKRGLIKNVLNVYATAFHMSHNESEAIEIRDSIRNFKEVEEGMELTTGVAKAIIDTRGSNPNDDTFRKKAAQQVFQEMFEQMAIGRIASVHNIDTEVSEIIDSPKIEQIDLTSAFLSNTWTGDERKKMLRNFNKLKRVLDKLEASTDQKVGLNTLWKWSNGTLPKDSSVFKILEYANMLDINITDTVAEAWQAEADRIEDENEEEDY